MRRLLATVAALALAAPASALAADFPTDLDPERAGRGADVVDTGRGEDLLAGGDGDDRLDGGRGDDVVVDTDGRDRVDGGPGDDRINVRDREGGDRVACGPGDDVVVADQGDEVADDCEWVSTEEAAGLVRQDAGALSVDDRRDLVEAMHELKRIPSPYDPKLPWYDQFVAWHEDAFSGNRSAHQSAAFLPWHREFLLMFEAALQTASGKPIALPYWDWTSDASTAAVFSDELMGPSGDPDARYAVTSGPFRKGAWRLYERDTGGESPFVPGVDQPPEGPYIERYVGSPGTQPPPTVSDVTQILSIGTYDAPKFNQNVRFGQSFRNALEGFGSPLPSHNSVHVYVGGGFEIDDVPQNGTMALGTSPNDPVFWLHHANIDRLWSAWSAVHGEVFLPESGGPTGINRGDRMAPFKQLGIDVTPGDLLSTRALGYRYDRDGAPGTAGRRSAGRAPDLREVAEANGLLCVL